MNQTMNHTGKAQRIKQAKNEAATEIAQYREKKEKNYIRSEMVASGPDAELTKKLELDTQAEIGAMQANFEANKEKVVNLLLHAVTSVQVQVAGSLKVKA